jgi:hypothetical protein
MRLREHPEIEQAILRAEEPYRSQRLHSAIVEKGLLRRPPA